MTHKSSTKDADPSGISAHKPGAKLDKGKNRLALVLAGFAQALVAIGRVGTYGANKYSPNGWMKVKGAEARYSDALMRHITAYWSGELVDKESGLPHLAHAGWNMLAWITFTIIAKAKLDAKRKRERRRRRLAKPLVKPITKPVTESITKPATSPARLRGSWADSH